MDFDVPAKPREKKAIQKEIQILGPGQGGKKYVEYQKTVIPIVVGALRTVFQRLGKGTGTVGNQTKNRDHPVLRSVKILNISVENG